jgi:hypothetical protein
MKRLLNIDEQTNIVQSYERVNQNHGSIKQALGVNIMEFQLRLTEDWFRKPLSQPILIELKCQGEKISFCISAPYYFNIPPDCPPGPTWRLWEYEVVEIFLVFEAQKYLEIEVNPHGHYLILALDGIRKIKSAFIPAQIKARIDLSKQSYQIEGQLHSPLPLDQLKALNAYAIYQEKHHRVYASYHAIALENEAPNFHLIDRFPLISKSSSIEKIDQS